MNECEAVQDRKKDKGIIKAIGSVLFAIVASSHHWVHTLLIALGLTILSSSLLSLSPPVKIIFLVVSLVLQRGLFMLLNVNGVMIVLLHGFILYHPLSQLSW